MIYNSMTDLINKVSSRYLLVNIVARRAREIQEMAEGADQILERKPVSFAIEEISNGTLKYEMNKK